MPPLSKSDYPRHSIFESFGFAIRGLWYTLTSQRNMRIHAVMGVMAVGAGLWVRLSATQWLALLISVWLVLVVEALNTSIELSVDLTTRKRRYRAMLSKDVAAGAVLMAAFNAVVVGLIIFGPHVLHFFMGVF